VHANHLDAPTKARCAHAPALTPVSDSATAPWRSQTRARALVILIAATMLIAGCGPNPNPNPVPRVPTPTPEPNRGPEPPVNPQTMSVTSTQILIDDAVSIGNPQAAVQVHSTRVTAS